MYTKKGWLHILFCSKKNHFPQSIAIELISFAHLLKRKASCNSNDFGKNEKGQNPYGIQQSRKLWWIATTKITNMDDINQICLWMGSVTFGVLKTDVNTYLPRVLRSAQSAKLDASGQKSLQNDTKFREEIVEAIIKLIAQRFFC